MPFSIDNLFLVFMFVFPGFVLLSTMGWLVPLKKDVGLREALGYLKLSVLNFAVCSPVVYLLLSSEYFGSHRTFAAILWFVVLFLVPFGFGTALGLLIQKGVVRRFSAFLGIDMISVPPTSWDFVFRNKPVSFVIVTLTDGSKVAGCWGPNSYASSDPEERDIFLELEFRISGTQQWSEIPDSSGILISGDNISSIEFFEAIGDSENDNDKDIEDGTQGAS